MSKKQNEITISIDTTTIIKGLALVVALIIVLGLLHNLAKPLILLSISFFLAIALNPAVSWITARLKSGSRIRATAIAYIFVMTVLIGFFSLIIPPLVGQTIDFVKDVPSTIEDFKKQDSPAARFAYRYNLDEQLDDFASDFKSRSSDVSKPALATATTIGSTFVSVIAVLVLTFMMLIEGPNWLKRFWAIQPASKRRERQETAQKMYKVVTGFVNGQFLVALIAGAFAFIALVIASQIFDVTINAIALAGIVTVFALMPLIGAALGATIVVLACLFVSFPLAITMAIYFVIYQQIENTTLQPYIQSKSNNLTPLIVFSAAIIGASLAGILGALFAIPIAGCLRILIQSHYKERLEKANLL